MDTAASLLLWKIHKQLWYVQNILTKPKVPRIIVPVLTLQQQQHFLSTAIIVFNSKRKWEIKWLYTAGMTYKTLVYYFQPHLYLRVHKEMTPTFGVGTLHVKCEKHLCYSIYYLCSNSSIFVNVYTRGTKRRNLKVVKYLFSLNSQYGCLTVSDVSSM